MVKCVFDMDVIQVQFLKELYIIVKLYNRYTIVAYKFGNNKRIGWVV